MAAEVIGEAPVISRSKASRLCGACNCNQPTCLTMGYEVQKLINDKGHWYFLGSWEVRSRHGGLLCSLPAASDVTTAHTPIWGRGRCIPLLV